VSDREAHARFSALTFEDFRRLATDPDLSEHERIGFPDRYREGKAPAILADIESKLTHLRSRERTVVDIGPGGGELARVILRRCERQQHRITLFDSREMLDRLPTAPHISKVAGRFPQECRERLGALAGRVDVVLAYSVLQYVFVEHSVVGFLDAALELLAPGGQLLIGDIPNVSQRRRFFGSETGVEYHKAFMRTSEPPDVSFNQISPGQIDDSVVLALVHRARASGFNAYVVPQAPGLPMANRREDLLIQRP
jgi:2-polyprenyl-3-methyl-5-hydroxy-6-metoxy-1,4-benzoquinol methylase